MQSCWTILFIYSLFVLYNYQELCRRLTVLSELTQATAIHPVSWHTQQSLVICLLADKSIFDYSLFLGYFFYMKCLFYTLMKLRRILHNLPCHDTNTFMPTLASLLYTLCHKYTCLKLPIQRQSTFACFPQKAVVAKYQAFVIITQYIHKDNEWGNGMTLNFRLAMYSVLNELLICMISLILM